MPTPPCTSASSPTRSTSTPTSRRSPTTSGPAPSGTGTSAGRRSTTPTRAERAWTTLAGRFRPGRARYLLDTLRPANLDRAPDEPPAFPETASAGQLVDAGGRGHRAARALGGDRVPGHLRGVPDLVGPGARPPGRRSVARRPRRRRRRPTPMPASRSCRTRSAGRSIPTPRATAGMLLTVRDSDMAFGRPLANGLTRLVVLGVDWTLTPEQGADALEALLAGHAASGDLAFVAPGTPTNNTGSNRSGFSTAPSEQVAAWAPPLAGADPDTARRRQRRPPRRRARRRRRRPRRGARAPAAATTPLASALRRRAVGGDRRLLRVRAARPPRQRRDHRPRPACTPRRRSTRPGRCRRSGSGRSPTACCRSRPGGCRRTSDSAADLNLHRVQRDAAGHVGGAARPGAPPRPRRRDAGRRRRAARPAPAHAGAVGAALAGDGPAAAVDGVRLAGHAPRPAGALARTTSPTGSDIPPDRPARIQYLTASPDSHPLGVPLVAKGDAGTSYVAEIAALARQGDDGRRELNLRQDSIALLEALLAFAAVQELDKAASAELVDGPHRGRSGGGRLRAQGRPHARPRAGRGARSAAAADAVRVGTGARRRRPLPARSVAGARPGGDAPARARALDEHIGQPASPVNGLARFLAALDVLAAAPADELEWAFRGVLDLFSSRLDAWFTSLRHRPPRRAAGRSAAAASTSGATAGSRTSAPTAVRRADSLGLHRRAVARPRRERGAAAQRPASPTRAEDAFDLDLSSARVREALRLLEGVAAGQPLAALLGYRIERKLTDAGLADLIVGLRIAAPLQARAGDLDTPVESVAARDVVDGLRLLAMLPTPAVAAAARPAAGDAASARPALEAVLRDVAGTYDAVSRRAARRGRAPDRGRQPRSGRRGDRRPRPPGAAGRARRHPHAPGRRGGHEPGRGRAAAARRPRRRPAGRHAACGAPPSLASTTGSARSSATRRCSPAGAASSAATPSTDLEPVSAAELGLSPLAFALTAGRPAADQPTELESRLAAVFAAQVADPAEADRIELDGASLLTDVATWASRLVSGCRPLQVSDLTPAGGLTGGAARAGRRGGRGRAARAGPTPRWPHCARRTPPSSRRRGSPGRCAARSAR